MQNGKSKVVKKDDVQSQELEKLVEEYKHKYLRALADYQNFERRVHEDKKRYHEKFIAEVLIKLLPIFDLVATMRSHEPYKSDQAINALHKELNAVLEGYGVLGFETVGLQFDPHKMECIEIIPTDDEQKNNKVAGEVLKGYTLGGKRLLRPARVKVWKKDL